MIGIGITTRNRPDVLDWALRHHAAFMPADARLVIVDDASDAPRNDVRLWHSPRRMGVARAKNECLLRLSECEHVFLFDDDAFPIRHGWADFYIGFGLAHLTHTIGQPHSGIVHDCYKSHHPHGVMCYFTRAALDAVGGYDVRFGLWGDEHVQLSRRIHAAGLTPWPFLSPTSTGAYVHAMDLQPEPTPLGWFAGDFAATMSTDEKMREQAHGQAVRDDLTVYQPVMGGQDE